MSNLNPNIVARMPRDLDSQPIQVLGVEDDGTVHISAIEASSNNAALPSNSKIVRIAASGAVWVAFGGVSDVAAASAANSFLFPAGVEVFYVNDPGYTHVAARSVSGSGNQVVSITKMN